MSEIKFGTLKKSHKKQIIIGALSICILGGALTFNLTRAKYKVTDSISLVKGNVNYQVPDMRAVAINVSEDGTNYNISDEIPTGEYTLNTDKTICKVATETSGIENAPQDNNITIEYVDGKINFKGITKNNTRCYLYFDKIRDTENPTINSVTTSVTKNSITVNVSASDNKGVTEYWYSLNGGTYTSKTTSSHTFIGLSSGTSYTISVYVKDEAGNTSAITTKSATTSSPTASEIILGNITVNSGTPTFNKLATTDEGVYSANDGMYGGTSYYWRGAVTNNYVKFANFCWRIIRINGDGSIRLIYDGSTCHQNGESANSIAITSQAYNLSNDRAEYVGWTYSIGSQRTTSGTPSNIKSQTEAWYNNNIKDNTIYSSKVSDGKFCNDRDVQSDYTWSSKPSTFYYAARERKERVQPPTLSCPSGDIYTLKVGLITVDEVVYAGGLFSATNRSYYLYNGSSYWTMSPCSGGNDSNVFYVTQLGEYFYYRLTTSMGIRPVINLKPDVTFSGGDGTQSNPYVVS